MTHETILQTLLANRAMRESAVINERGQLVVKTSTVELRLDPDFAWVSFFATSGDELSERVTTCALELVKASVEEREVRYES